MVIWSVACVVLPRCDAIDDKLIRCVRVCVDDASDTIRMLLFVQMSIKYSQTMRSHRSSRHITGSTMKIKRTYVTYSHTTQSYVQWMMESTGHTVVHVLFFITHVDCSMHNAQAHRCHRSKCHRTSCRS